MTKTKRTCDGCGRFAPEPGSVGRGCCWHSPDLDSYRVVGASQRGCGDWAAPVQTNYEKFLGDPERASEALAGSMRGELEAAAGAWLESHSLLVEANGRASALKIWLERKS